MGFPYCNGPCPQIWVAWALETTRQLGFWFQGWYIWDRACAPLWHHVGCVDAQTEKTEDSNHQKGKACCHHGRMPIVTTSEGDARDDPCTMCEKTPPQTRITHLFVSTGFVHFFGISQSPFGKATRVRWKQALASDEPSLRKWCWDTSANLEACGLHPPNQNMLVMGDHPTPRVGEKYLAVNYWHSYDQLIHLYIGIYTMMIFHGTLLDNPIISHYISPMISV